jgi:hypothetical protein
VVDAALSSISSFPGIQRPAVSLPKETAHFQQESYKCTDVTPIEYYEKNKVEDEEDE